MNEKDTRRRSPAAVLAGLLATVLAGPAAASAADGPARDEPVLFETAVVRARELERATAAVEVFDRQQIEALDVRTVAELIRHVPGVDLVAAGSRASTAAAQIRGGDPQFTVVLIDGVPLNDTTDQLGGAVNLAAVPVAHVERIEVIRGPQSSSVGSAGLSGVINIITRRGRGGPAPRVGFDATAGDDETRQAAVSLAAGTDRGDWFVGATRDEEDGRVGDDRFEQLDLVGNAARRLGDHELRFTGRVTRWEGEDYPEASGGPVYGPGATRASQSDEATLGAEVWLGGGARRHRLDLTAFRRELERTSPGAGDVDGDGIADLVPPSAEETRYTDARLGWSWPVVQRRRLRVAIGAEIARESGENDSVLFTGFGPVDGDYELERTTGAAFAELIAERGPVVFELGGRVDDADDFDAEFSPRAGLAWNMPDGATRLRASVGRGFKLPSFFVLASPPALGGNPDLRPETSTGGDVELSRRFERADVTASVAVFHYVFEDLITFVFDPFGFVNLDEVESTGAELDVTWRLATGLVVRANATRQEVEDRETSETLRQRPDWYGGARLTWRPSERWSWELDGQWVSESVDETLAPTPGPRTSTAGYQLYGTALRYRISSRWEVHGRVSNLADKAYETFIGFPGPGRHFRVGIRRLLR